MNKTITAALLAISIGALAIGAHAQNNPEARAISPFEHDFLWQASQDNMLEIMLGKYACQNATINRVKTFGRIMVIDHSKAADRLNSLAAERRIWLLDTLDAKHWDMYTHITSQQGPAFDTAYIAAMKDGHMNCYQMYQDADKRSLDMDIHAYTDWFTPMVKEHLDLIEDIDASNKM